MHPLLTTVGVQEARTVMADASTSNNKREPGSACQRRTVTPPQPTTLVRSAGPPATVPASKRARCRPLQFPRRCRLQRLLPSVPG